MTRAYLAAFGHTRSGACAHIHTGVRVSPGKYDLYRGIRTKQYQYDRAVCKHVVYTRLVHGLVLVVCGLCAERVARGHRVVPATKWGLWLRSTHPLPTLAASLTPTHSPLPTLPHTTHSLCPVTLPVAADRSSRV